MPAERAFEPEHATIAAASRSHSGEKRTDEATIA